MQSFINGLIFPAPKAGYTQQEFKDKLIYIPKFSDWQEHKKLWKRNDERKATQHRAPKELSENNIHLPDSQFASPNNRKIPGEGSPNILTADGIKETIYDDILSISVKDPENDSTNQKYTSEPTSTEDLQNTLNTQIMQSNK